jgi:ABC-2 type transport system permease protein
VNPQHLRAFLRLRWRLRINQLRRGGIANTIILVFLIVAAVFLALGLFATFLLIGLFAFAKASPVILMLVCDGLAGGLLICWTLGLLVDLQRSESLSLDKFLHLPVSVAGVFLINYLSSLFSVTLLFFLPALIGLGLGLLWSRGPALLSYFPLLAAFLLMVTALTYQFQGWLSSLMVNARRRRTIIVAVTVGFILVAQLPNIVMNVVKPWKKDQVDEIAARRTEALAELDRARVDHKIPDAEFTKHRQRIEEDYNTAVVERKEHAEQRFEHTLTLINQVLPPAWFPLGVTEAAQGNVLPALLGTLGLSLIGTASLWRSYQTTVRVYKGQFRTRKKRTPRAPVAAQPAAQSRTNFLEKKIPGLSERASTIALGSLRSFIRAPETKLMMLGPVILVFIFGSMLVAHGTELPEALRPLLPLGPMAMVMLTMIQFAGNQFGFDRSGFRVFVLCASPRREILLGKNLALAPWALGFGMAAVILLQATYPTHLDYFLAAIPLMLSVFLIYAAMANWLSILAPMPMAPGSFKPTHYKGLPILIHFAFMLLFPVALAPTLAPLGIAMTLRALQWIDWVPICLILSVVECVAIIYLYRLVLTWQGDVLQAREQRILEIVTKKAE